MAAATLLGFLLALAGIVALLVPAIVDEFSDLGPTLEDAVDDLEDWLVDDSPFDVSRAGHRRTSASRPATGPATTPQSQSGAVVSGTVMAVEVLTGLVPGVDHHVLPAQGRRPLRPVDARVRCPTSGSRWPRRLAARSWQTLGGYLRGSATLGVIEGFIIGITVWLVGGALAVPVAVITFFAAFLPFAGAVLAGTVAVLVTLVTAGPGEALIVLIVAVARAAVRQRPAGADRVRQEPRAPSAHRARRHRGRQHAVRRVRRGAGGAGHRGGHQRLAEIAGRRREQEGEAAAVGAAAADDDAGPDDASADDDADTVDDPSRDGSQSRVASRACARSGPGRNLRPRMASTGGGPMEAAAIEIAESVRPA